MTVGVSTHKLPETPREGSSIARKLNPTPSLAGVRGGFAVGPPGSGFIAGKDPGVLGGDLSEEQKGKRMRFTKAFSEVPFLPKCHYALCKNLV